LYYIGKSSSHIHIQSFILTTEFRNNLLNLKFLILQI